MNKQLGQSRRTNVAPYSLTPLTVAQSATVASALFPAALQPGEIEHNQSTCPAAHTTVPSSREADIYSQERTATKKANKSPKQSIGLKQRLKGLFMPEENGTKSLTLKLAGYFAKHIQARGGSLNPPKNFETANN